MDHRPPAIFVADAIGLDFLNSIATPVDMPVDWIDDGEGLLAWLAQAQLVPAEILDSLRVQALPGEIDKIADQARDLREWFRGFVRAHRGRPLTVAALAELEPLNRLLERDEGFSRVVAAPAPGAGGGNTDGGNTGGGNELAYRTMRRWRSPEALLLPIGEAMARLVCTEDFTQVKACEGPTCTLLFADHTRGHARRWCSMAICGNRAKQAAHRHRQKSHQH